MDAPGSAPPLTRRVHRLSWLDGWRLRTKVAVVLAVPVIVALALGGLRVRAQWDESNRLSSVRDQATVLRGVIDLASLVDRESMAAVSAVPPEGLDARARAAAVDQEATEVQSAADNAGLPPDVGRRLSAAIGRLTAIRSGGARDLIVVSSAYHDVVGDLSEVVTGVVASASASDLDNAANVVRLLLQLHSTLAQEEGLLRSVEQGRLPAATIAATQRAASEESVLTTQLQRAITGPTAASFADVSLSASSRRDVLDAALSTDLTAELRGLLPGLESEMTGLEDLLGGYIGTLADQITARSTDARDAALRDAAIVLGALAVTVLIALLVARSILVPLRRLHGAVRSAADDELPDTVRRIMTGEHVDWRAVEPVPVGTSEEIGQLARGFDEMHRQAVRMAGEQADLRRQVGEMFMTLSRRSQSLVERQLSEIELLEAQEQDPRRLESLFRLDHLATRLRRNGENLQVLAGGAPARPDQTPVTAVELLRAATSAVKDYRRVTVAHAPGCLVRGHAAADVVHVLAELLDNATRYSPPEAKVVLTADRGADGGLLVEVVDRGLGMTADDLAAANERLAATGRATPETTRRMGLFVVSKLADRHGVVVRLRSTTPGLRTAAGITASVHVPGELVVSGATTEITDVTEITRVTDVVAQTAPVRREPPARDQARWHPQQWPEPNGHPPSTPIFDQLAPRWFTEAQAPADAARTQPSWPTSDQHPDQPAEPDTPVIGTTVAGLPMRRPGARLRPGAPGADTPAPPRSSRAPVRDATAIRNNLSRHYDGMRRARQRTRTEPGER